MGFIEIHWLHIILAYAGLAIHVLMKLGELDKGGDFKLKEYIKKYKWQMLASVLMIPVLLFMATDESLKDVLPLNNVTATLAGWQTNSVFKALMGMYKPKQVKASE